MLEMQKGSTCLNCFCPKHEIMSRGGGVAKTETGVREGQMGEFSMIGNKVDSSREGRQEVK